MRQPVRRAFQHRARQLGRSGIGAQAVELAGQPALPARRALAIEVGQEQHSARAGRHARRELEQRRPGPAGHGGQPVERSAVSRGRSADHAAPLGRARHPHQPGRAVGTAHRHDQASGTSAGVARPAQLIEPGGPERQQRIRCAGYQRSTPRHPPRPVGRPDHGPGRRGIAKPVQRGVAGPPALRPRRAHAGQHPVPQLADLAAWMLRFEQPALGDLLGRDAAVDALGVAVGHGQAVGGHRGRALPADRYRGRGRRRRAPGDEALQRGPDRAAPAPRVRTARRVLRSLVVVGAGLAGERPLGVHGDDPDRARIRRRCR